MNEKKMVTKKVENEEKITVFLKIICPYLH